MNSLFSLLGCLAAQAADPELGAALEKLAKADRYAFKVEIVQEGGEGAGRLGAIEGRFLKDRPTWMKFGELEVYRKGDRLAVQKKSEWRILELRESDKRRGRLRTLRLPHEELADLPKRLTSLRIWLTSAGDLAMAEIIVRGKGKGKGGAGVSMWITLSEIGSAKAEVPEGALRALEGN